MEIVIVIYFAIVLSPAIGLIMLLKSKSPEHKVYGGIIMAVGVVLWMYLGIYKC